MMFSLIKIVIRLGGALLVQENKLRRIKVPMTRNLFLHFLPNPFLIKKIRVIGALRETDINAD